MGQSLLVEDGQLISRFVSFRSPCLVSLVTFFFACVLPPQPTRCLMERNWLFDGPAFTILHRTSHHDHHHMHYICTCGKPPNC